MSLIVREDLIAEYDRVHQGPPGGARKLMKEAKEAPAIPISWIEEYADWLTTIPAPFAANDEKSIRAMLTKWRTNPDLPDFGSETGGGSGGSGADRPADGCKDYCDL